MPRQAWLFVPKSLRLWNDLHQNNFPLFGDLILNVGEHLKCKFYIGFSLV